MNKEIKQLAALGLEWSGREVRLVHVTADDGFHVDQFATAKAERVQELAAAIGEAFSKLPPSGQEGPLAICVADDLVLFRTLSLPSAGAKQLQEMVRGQMEVLLPAQEDLFLCNWSTQRHPLHEGTEHVTVCMARKDAIKPLMDAATQGRKRPSAAMAGSMARASLAAINGGAEAIAIVDATDKGTTLNLLYDGRLFHGGFIHNARVLWEKPVEGQGHVGVEEWMSQLREVFNVARAELPPAVQLEKCWLTGDAVTKEYLQEWVKEALGLQAEPAPKPLSVHLQNEMEFGAISGAVGAAIELLQPSHRVCCLMKDVRRRALNLEYSPKRWAIAGAWLLGLVLALYGLDVYEAHWTGQAFSRMRTEMSQGVGQEKLLAIGGYLEQSGATPLMVLDEVSAAAPPQTILSNFRYTRGGEASVSGTVPSEVELNAFIDKLSRSPVLKKVTFHNAKSENGMLRFELSFKLGGLSIATQPTSQPATAAAPPKSSPASSAASGPTPGGGASRPHEVKPPSTEPLGTMPAAAGSQPVGETK